MLLSSSKQIPSNKITKVIAFPEDKAQEFSNFTMKKRQREGGYKEYYNNNKIMAHS